MEVVIILVLILLNGVFSMSEIALVSSRRTKLEIAAKNGSKKALAALNLSNNPSRFLSTVQIGITLISILTGIFSGDQLKDYLIPYVEQIDSLNSYASSLSVAIITIIVTFLSLILGELVPKRIGMSSPEKIATFMVGPMNILSKITSPFIWLLTKVSDFLFRLTGISESDSSITEEEIRSMVQEGATGGTIEEIEHEIVQNVFHLGDRRVTSLMTNSNEVAFLDIEDSIIENKNKLIESRHSVFPVCKDGLDNVLGLLYTKDLLGRNLDSALKNVERILREALFIPENNQTYQVLEKFQEEHKHFGVIVDEYGNCQGVITMNDIMDALVGDISEENEFEYEITPRDDGSFLIDASLPFDEFLNEFEIDINNRKDYSGFDTMGGFALEILQEIPDTGDKFTWEGYEFEIIDMDKNRIDKILVQQITADEDNGKEEKSEKTNKKA
ncbi:MAG: putative hemolysin [Spirosomataceae bacterium]|jgi:putative hemolysin